MPVPQPNTKHTLLGNSIWIFLIRVMPALASLLVLIIFSRQLDAGFYGFYQRFWVRFQVYSAIACLGLPALLLTYPPDRIRQFVAAGGRKVFWGLGGWLVLVAGVFAAQQFHDRTLFLAAFAFLSVHALIAVCEAYLMAARRFRFIAAGSTAYALAFILAHLLFLRYRIGFPALLLLLLAAGALRCAALLAGAMQRYRQTPAGHSPAHLLKGVRSLWLHLGIYDVIQTIFRWADKFVLSFFLANELLAVYVNGTVDVPLLPILLGAVGSALLLHLSEEPATDDARGDMLKSASSRLALIVFPLFFFFVCFRHELFSVVFTYRYAAAVPLFLISSLVIPLRAYNFTAILQSQGKGSVINAGALLDLGIALVLLYPLYLLWGLNGVALAFVISTYVQAGFYLWHTARSLHCRMTDLLPLRSWTWSGGLCALLFFMGHSLLAAHFKDWQTLLLGGCLLGISLLAVLARQLLLNRNSHGNPTEER